MRSAEDRFWDKVTMGPNGCWLWSGRSDNGSGYFQFQVDKRLVYVHRFAHELLYGPIPSGLQVDHQCNNKRCVRHLKAMTGGENTRRWSDAKSHCKHGHEYDEANTYIDPGGGRQCRTCRRQKQLARYYRLKESA